MVREPEQLELATLYPCDICEQGLETDCETGSTLRCRVCGGCGSLPYNPADLTDNPFTGLEDGIPFGLPPLTTQAAARIVRSIRDDELSDQKQPAEEEAA